MLPFVIYLVAAGLTGFQVYSLMVLARYGAPVSPLEFLSLLGSFLLLVGAYLSLWKPQAAAKVALIACLLIWCFYAPATLNTVRGGLANHGTTSPPAKGAR